MNFLGSESQRTNHRVALDQDKNPPDKMKVGFPSQFAFQMPNLLVSPSHLTRKRALYSNKLKQMAQMLEQRNVRRTVSALLFCSGGCGGSFTISYPWRTRLPLWNSFSLMITVSSRGEEKNYQMVYQE
ncbi:hypothetical protein CEXT_183371 [Caerostris extrusa]|uniref:Uncharacterized protein n=1 Tax=Caerostris extrusa TaxID=172846 RepID=A0AAV4VEI7_CAEEX|nr:hypothetical protein CEXT_183371 [Caerostris extrusa]